MNEKNIKFKLIIIFLLFYAALFPVIFNFSEKRVNLNNQDEVFDVYKMAITLKYDSLFVKFNLINDLVNKLNKDYFYFTEDNIRVYRPHNFEFNFKRSQVNENFSIIFGEKNDIYFQIPFLAMKRIILLEKEVKEMVKHNNLFCKKIHKIENVSEVSIDNYNLSIILKLTQRRSQTNLEDLSENLKKCFESIIAEKTKILINYLKNYYDMSFKENNFLLKNYIDDSKGLYFDANNVDIVMNNISQIPTLFFKDLEKNFFNLRYTGPFEITEQEAYKRDFNIYFISAILAFLINILFFIFLFFLKKKVIFLSKIF